MSNNYCQSLSYADVTDDEDGDVGSGSPFQFTVGPVKNGGAHKIVAVGEGLHSATVCQPGTTFVPFTSSLS